MNVKQLLLLTTLLNLMPGLSYGSTCPNQGCNYSSYLEGDSNLDSSKEYSQWTQDILNKPTSCFLEVNEIWKVTRVLDNKEACSFLQNVLDNNPKTILKAIAARQLAFEKTWDGNDWQPKKTKKLFERSRSLLKKLTPTPAVLEYLYDVETRLEMLKKGLFNSSRELITA